jgi:hypothetical protein
MTDAEKIDLLRNALQFALEDVRARLYMLPIDGRGVSQQKDILSVQIGRYVGVLQQTQSETSTETLNRQLRESIAVEDYKAVHPRRECLCIVGCSVNGECPLHGDLAMPIKGYTDLRKGK